jgi:hypothetical protein
MNNSTNVPAIEVIDYHIRQYAEAREILAARVMKLEAEVAAVRNRLLPGIKHAVAYAADLQSALSAEVQRHPDLFIKPRTITLRGIRVGFVKGKGKISWEDNDKVIAAIRRTFAPATADKLIAITERPIKDALAQLPAAELKKLGVTIEEVGDQILIKAVDDQVDKLVARVLKEGEIEEAEAAAK